VSNIYDALRKAGAEDPRPATGEGGEQRRTGLAPRGRVSGKLIGDPDAELLRDVDGLRQSIEGALGPAPRRVVGFAGAVAGEGTTTIAVSLAHLLARVVDRRVLLIDADMGRTSGGLSAAVGEHDGLTEVLRRQTPVDEALLATEAEGLHFLPAGKDRVHQIEAAAAGPVRPLFEHLGDAYDWVVVDLPPVLRHPETRMLASACTGVVFVVRANRTPRTVSQRALSELALGRCRVLGSVLNARRESLPRFLLERV
jgi:Mrp family chromosome partitioning ATPase